MSSGNPFGLAEISHFGAMQRVGGKAGGFINKKFFHPSSFRNQEKLWKAQTEQARKERLQQQLELQREEEHQVEALRKEMYLRGQNISASDSLFGRATGGAASSALTGKAKREQLAAFVEFKRRKALLKEDHAKSDGIEVIDDDSDDAPASNVKTPADDKPVTPALAKSMYPEDVLVLGHDSVWGSWFALDSQRWGFACCRVCDRKKWCPIAPEDASAAQKDKADKAERADRGKRRRRGSRDVVAIDHAAAASGHGASSGSRSVATGDVAATSSEGVVDVIGSRSVARGGVAATSGDGVVDVAGPRSVATGDVAATLGDGVVDDPRDCGAGEVPDGENAQAQTLAGTSDASPDGGFLCSMAGVATERRLSSQEAGDGGGIAEANATCSGVTAVPCSGGSPSEACAGTPLEADVGRATGGDAVGPRACVADVEEFAGPLSDAVCTTRLAADHGTLGCGDAVI